MGIRKGQRVAVLGCWRRWGTDADREAWYASDLSKGMTCAGETKLPPLVVRRDGETTMMVVKGRAKSCRTSYWTNPPTGVALLVDDEGVEWFAPRKGLRAV